MGGAGRGRLDARDLLHAASLRSAARRRARVAPARRTKSSCKARAWAAVSAARKRRRQRRRRWRRWRRFKRDGRCGCAFNRDQDMMLTGHRHPFLAQFKVGFDAQRHIARGSRRNSIPTAAGRSIFRRPVTDRALFHLDNCYYIPQVEFRGQVAKTQSFVEHGVSRIRRAAGNAGHRGNH